MNSKNLVLNFIDEFTNRGTWPQVIDSFTRGNCYWFAYILKGRFPEGTIVYDEIMNHFGFLLDNNIYDITGVVTNKYDWDTWENAYNRDELRGKRIIRDCILKEKIK